MRWRRSHRQWQVGALMGTGEMKVVTTYDEEVDAGYLHLAAPGGDGSVVRTLEATAGAGTAFTLNLDLSERGHLVGIEIVGVRHALGEQAFAAFTGARRP